MSKKGALARIKLMAIDAERDAEMTRGEEPGMAEAKNTYQYGFFLGQASGLGLAEQIVKEEVSE